MDAPVNFPDLEKRMFMYLPNREELSFRMVRALPNASRMGLLCSTCCSMLMSSSERGVAPNLLGVDRVISARRFESMAK